MVDLTQGQAAILDSGAYLAQAQAVRDLELTLKIVESWHNDKHAGVFRFCGEQPCHALNYAERPKYREPGGQRPTKG